MKLDLDAIRSAIVTRLPVRARWWINGTPLDYNFEAARVGLRGLRGDMGESDSGAPLDLLIFGDYDYAEGGGAHPWLGIQRTDGTICGFDPEAHSGLFFLNSSIEEFIRTFTFLNDYLGTNCALPSDVETRLRVIDPHGYPTSDWRLLAECLASESEASRERP